MAKSKAKTKGGPLGFEATLWAAADKLRGHMDAAEYKHVVLGLIFLKYISDAFEVRRSALAADPEADPEDPDEYLRAGVFWVPKESRWEVLHDAATLERSPLITTISVARRGREGLVGREVVPQRRSSCLRCPPLSIRG